MRISVIDNDPLLSIIVPVYNTCGYLRDCLDSVLSQDYHNIEVWLIDDGSTDGSDTICDEYSLKDSRVFVVHQSNAGQGRARNIGLERCKGKYITFIDSDDRISVNVYSGNIKILEREKEVDVLQYPYCYLYEEGQVEEGISGESGKIILSLTEKYKEAFMYNRIRSYMPNKIFRREIFDNLRFPEDMVYEDRFLLPMIIEKSGAIMYSNIGMYYYRSRWGQTTKQINHYSIESKLRADLNIVKYVSNLHHLENVIVERYCNCLYYARLLPSPLRRRYLLPLKSLIPSLSIIMRSQCALGLKIKCILMRLSYRFVGL